MSIERQPGMLASKNLRRELESYKNQKTKKETPVRTGLLTPTNVQSRINNEQQPMTEVEKIMEAMLAIREGMAKETV